MITVISSLVLFSLLTYLISKAEEWQRGVKTVSPTPWGKFWSRSIGHIPAHLKNTNPVPAKCSEWEPGLSFPPQGGLVTSLRGQNLQSEVSSQGFLVAMAPWLPIWVPSGALQTICTGPDSQPLDPSPTALSKRPWLPCGNCNLVDLTNPHFLFLYLKFLMSLNPAAPSPNRRITFFLSRAKRCTWVPTPQEWISFSSL